MNEMNEDKFTETMKILEKIMSPQELVVFMSKLNQGVEKIADSNDNFKTAIQNQKMQTRMQNLKNCRDQGCQTDKQVVPA